MEAPPIADNPDEVIALVGSAVQRQRQAAGLSQRQLATAITKSHGWIGRIEAGHQVRVSRATAEAIADALQVPLSAISVATDDERATASTEHGPHPSAELLEAAAEIRRGLQQLQTQMRELERRLAALARES